MANQKQEISSFSERLKLVRYAYGLSQKDIAGMAGTFIQNVSRWEKKSYEPRAEIKKKIAEALNLTVNWFITGVGFPFRTGKIIHVKPQPKHFVYSLQLLSIGITCSDRTKVIFFSADMNDAYYFLYFYIKDTEGSIVSIYTPLGYDEWMQSFLKLHSAVNYLGAAAVLDSAHATQLKNSFYLALERFKYYEEKDHKLYSKLVTPENYFFIDLYNANKSELEKILFSIRDKGQQTEGTTEKILSFLETFEQQRSDFKNIIKAWLKREPLTKEALSPMEKFIGQASVSDVLHLREQFNWEADLIKAVMEGDLIPFVIAYKEIVSLMIAAGQGRTIIKPKINEKDDKLYWEGKIGKDIWELDGDK